MLLIGTVGINTKDKSCLMSMIDEGLDTLRMNFSHSNIKEFDKIINEVSDMRNKIHIIVDLCGSKIRVSKKLRSTLKINENEKVIFCSEEAYEDIYSETYEYKVIPLNISYRDFSADNIKKISMKDGTMRFSVLNKGKNIINTRVIKGGIVRRDKGCNLIGINRDNLELSNIDKRAIDWAMENNADIICQSYVESSRQIIDVRNYIKRCDYKPKIYGKIESEKAIENLEEIINEADGIVIGRGDLVPETSMIETPVVQDKIIKKAKEMNKPVIIGTHVLDSMKTSKHPELCEVEAIYNNILKGVDGFLLAGETSVGRYPKETVRLLNMLVKRYGNEV